MLSLIKMQNKTSLTRLNQDECTYEQNLRQSTLPGEYMVNVPHSRCQEKFVADPQIRMSSQVRQPSGVSRCASKHIIDVDSELRNITRPATNCPKGKFLGEKYCDLVHFEDDTNIRTPTEDTRLSNPPCTLRGTGWNRWEWLCQNPQDKALVPFDFNINYRLIAKDNHRPCIPTPIEDDKTLPPNSSDYYGYVPNKEPVADFPTGVHWRSCDTYAQYNN
jgi:hypothetical protein